MSTLVQASSAVWRLLDAVLGPVMYVLVGLPGRVHPLLGLVPLSALLGAAAVLIFRMVSNQERIKDLRERMKGHLLATLIYNHSFRAVMRSIRAAFSLNAVYLYHASVPILIIVVPFMVLYVQLQQWYSWRPPREGEACLISAYYPTSAPEGIRLTAPSEWTVEEGLDFPSDGSVVWRVTPRGESAGPLHVETASGRFSKSIASSSSDRLTRLSPARTDGSALAEGFANPYESRLPPEAGIRSITVAYPTREFAVAGWYVHWAVWFVGLTILAGLVWGRVLGVSL